MEAKKPITYYGLTFDDIIKWCQENDRVEWLKTECSRTFPVSGTTKKGKPKKDRKISQLEVMKNFVEAFMPDIIPEKEEKKPSFRDIVNGL